MRPYMLLGGRWARLGHSRLVACAATVVLAAGLAGYAISGATAGTGQPGAAGRLSPAAGGSVGGAMSFNAATGTTTWAQPQRPQPQTAVTLITGDQAELVTAPDGQQIVNPVPAAGGNAARGSSGFARFSWGGDQYLVPDEAAAYLASGVLDPRLFDVSYLAQARFGSALPVQLSYSGRAVPSLPGLHVSYAAWGTATGTLASAQALRFGGLLASAQAAAMARHASPGVLPGITRIMLAPRRGGPLLPAPPTAAFGLPAAPGVGASQRGLAYHTLTLRFTAPGGTAGTAFGFVQNVHDSNLSPGGQQPIGVGGEPGLIVARARGTYSLSVPDGTYSAEFSIITPHPGTFRRYDAALVVSPQFTVDSNRTITLDARSAVPYHVRVSGVTAPRVQTDELAFDRASTTGPAINSANELFLSYIMDLISVSGDGYTGSQLSASPTAAATQGVLGFQASTWLGAQPFGSTGPKPTYILNFPAQGRIPSSLSYTVAKQDLTAYHQNLYANPLGTCGHSDTPIIWVYQPAVGAAAAWQYAAVPGGSRTDYWYDAAPRLDEWQPTLLSADCSTSGWSIGLQDAPRQIRQGGQVTETWDKAPLAAPPAAAPAFDSDTGDLSPLLTKCPACRQGDNAFVTLTPYGDSNPAHYHNGSPPASSSNSPGVYSTLKFYTDGRLALTSAASCEISGSVSLCDMDPNGLELPLLARAARYGLDWSYVDWSSDTVAATTVHWTFRSAPKAAAGRLAGGERCAPDPTEGCSYLPLLFVGYDLALNHHGQARAGQSFPVIFTVSHQQGETPPATASATVAASFDNGKAWTTPQAARSLGGGRFTATITQPALSRTSGFVSLRVTARDGAGDSVTETLIKAYGLTG